VLQPSHTRCAHRGQASVVCIVYAVDDQASFARITGHWLPVIRRTLAAAEGRTRVPVILVGNKVCHSLAQPSSRLSLSLSLSLSFFLSFFLSFSLSLCLSFPCLCNVETQSLLTREVDTRTEDDAATRSLETETVPIMNEFPEVETCIEVR
jgi:GTPase SAR1 family protein